ncbi:MAG: nickel-dependent hydrogenase large subunit [bacterium]
MHNFDLSLDHITKVEGSASLFVSVKDDKVTDVKFKIIESKRFFTEALKGKPLIAVPPHLSRICGTCSNAHVLAAIEACENALDIKASPQTRLLRSLTIHGLIIRDHALHLYLFVMPDLFNKNAFLDFDENDPIQHQLLHDGFNIKAAGNFLATTVAGRSVHAIYPTIGGFLRVPNKQDTQETIQKLKAIRPAVLRLVETFKNALFEFHRETTYMALVPEKKFGYIKGSIKTSAGEVYPESEFKNHLEHTVLPYSQASAYTYQGRDYMVGALSRINLAKDLLHHNTKEALGNTLDMFPSTNIHHTNLAQAIEILHSVDEAIEMLKHNTFLPEPLVKASPRAAVGIGVIEAPRGTLYHKVVTDKDGIVIEGEVVVPTGQNQLNIERDIGRLVEELLPTKTKEEISMEIEKLIRAYDPCMSCAAHFLKVKWEEK